MRPMSTAIPPNSGQPRSGRHSSDGAAAGSSAPVPDGGAPPRDGPPPEAGRSAGPPAWLRILIPVLLIIVWFGLGGVGGPYFGKISEVQQNDQASYLPASSASTKVSELQPEFTDSDAVPAVVLYVNDAGLTDADRAFIQDREKAFADAPGVSGGVSPAQYSEDGKAAEIFVPITDDDAAADNVENLSTVAKDGVPGGLTAYVTGPAGQLADISQAFGGIDGALLIVAVIAVLVILVIVYRSPLLPILVLLTSILALSAAILAVYWLAKAGAVTLNGQVQGILFILGIGAATDYSLLYVSRYREALRDHADRWGATRAALRGTLEPVSASAGTVVAGLLCLLLSDLNSNKALGAGGFPGDSLFLPGRHDPAPVTALRLWPGSILAAPPGVRLSASGPRPPGPRFLAGGGPHGAEPFPAHLADLRRRTGRGGGGGGGLPCFRCAAE